MLEEAICSNSGFSNMQPSIELIDDLFREKIIRARNTPPAEKLLAGARLFERSCRIMKDGIRHQFPDADEEQVDRILTERLAILRRLEEVDDCG
jgi:hypothetical protein